MEQSTNWIADNILNIDQTNESYACVVLNRDIHLKPIVFLRLWNNAKVRVLVDGGANKWLKYVSDQKLQAEPPHYLTGDMDSITAQSREKLIELKCQFICTPDQDETDFTKTLMVTHPFLVENNIKNVITLTDFSGRIDHTLSQINTLFKAIHFLATINVYMMTEDSLAWILCPGHHQITVPEHFVTEEQWCSYIPINGANRVTTNGFKWDLKNHIVEFGGIVSSSNTYAQSVVRIKCDGGLFWSMEINHVVPNNLND